MDPPYSSPISKCSHRPDLQRSRTSSINSAVDRQRPEDSRRNDTLKREHNDGDVLSSNSKPKTGYLYKVHRQKERYGWTCSKNHQVLDRLLWIWFNCL